MLADLPGVNPALFYGGAVGSLVLVPDGDQGSKGGLPQNVYSAYGLFSFTGALDGVTASIGGTHVALCGRALRKASGCRPTLS